MTYAKLAAFVPCKRFDFKTAQSDGSGGWVFSQFGVDRTFQGSSNGAVKLGLAVIVQPTSERDHVRATTVRALTSSGMVGESVLKWKEGNHGGSFRNGISIFEWIQEIEFSLNADVLVDFEVRILLSSSDDEVVVDGHGSIFASSTDSAKSPAFPLNTSM